MDGKVGYINKAFTHSNYPYLLVGIKANINIIGGVMMQAHYKGLNRPPTTLSAYTKNKLNKYSYCLYRVSDGVVLMWSRDFFSIANMVINPLVWELESVADEPTTT